MALVGAGTVLTIDDVAAADAAGARFVLSPVHDPDVMQEARRRGLLAIPGAATPSEIQAAHRQGAELVKVFPSGALGGPTYLRAIRGPLGHVPMIPTSGPTIESMEEWFAAGASVVGVGPEVLTPTATAEMVRDLPKRPGQIWIGISHECRRHVPLMIDPAYDSRLDLRMDYRFDSDVPAPYFTWNTLQALRRPPVEKTADAPAAAFISSVLDGNDRLDYVRELMRHMPVNSYGRQLNNRVLEHDEGRRTKDQVLARHKFTLAFENTCDHDYVTEKFFDPLIVGSVPVYLGAPNIRDFAPGEKCYIDAADFDSPKALADFLLGLDRDDAAYGEYLEWKQRPFRAGFMRIAESVREPNYARLLPLVEARLSNPPHAV